MTIAFILSIATVMNYSGMTSSMALALAQTGWLFPFFSAWLGMLGVFLTGSDTSSNTLFGPLQATTAKVSGLDPILMGATNSSAGVMGKMISPQNLSVGAAGVGAVGREGEIFSKVIFHSLVLTGADGPAGDVPAVRGAVDDAEAVAVVRTSGSDFSDRYFNSSGISGGGSGIFFGPGAASAAWKLQVLCEPSQNGFSFDWPQRHSANGFFGTMYSAPVQSTNFTSSPSTAASHSVEP